MFLKKIEMIGFKSFADKTIVELEAGITGIVGPNGCGKSNITDAIRWVLGEQSAKELRGAKMMDVIFNGTDKRHSLGMAEVNIYFDNSSRVLPIDFNEIVITRRLFRTGDSEYFINKIGCRLKDIHELLMDTGLGVNSYSVMSQGKLDFLVNAKPEERRFLFEEAAGITKYKHRKIEALRKLDKVTINLNRVNDIVQEIEKQIRRLDSQVRKVKKVKSLQETIKNIEVSHFLDLIQIKSQEKNNLVNNLSFKNEENRKNESDISALEVSVQNYRFELEERDKKLASVQERMFKLDSEISMCEEKIKMTQNMIDEYTNSINDKEKFVMLQENELVSVKDKTKNIDEEIMRRKGILETCEQNVISLRAEFQKNYDNYEKSKKDLEEKKEIFLNLTSEKSRINNELSTIKADIQNGGLRLEKLEHQVLSITSKSTESESNLNDILEKINRLSGEIDVKQSEYNDIVNTKNTISQEIIGYEEEKFKMNNERSVKKSLFETLYHLKNDFEGYEKGTQEVLKANILGVKNTVADIIDVDSEYLNLVEYLFSFYLNAIIVDTEEEALSAIKYLSENKKGRCLFIVKEKLSHITNEINIPSWIKVKDESYKKIVEYIFGKHTDIKDNILFSDVSIAGGMTDKEKDSDHAIIGRQTKIAKLEEELKIIDDNIENLNTKLENKKLEFQNIEQNIKDLEKNINDKKLYMAVANKEQEVHKFSIEELTEEKNVLISEKDYLAKDLLDKEQYKNELTIELKTISEQENDLSQDIQKITIENTSLENLVNELRDTYTAKQLEFNEIKNKENILNMEQEKWRSLEENINTRISETKEEITGLKNKIIEQNNIKQNNENNIKGVYLGRTKVEEDYQSIIEQKEEKLEMFRNIETELKNKKHVLDEIRNKERSIEMQTVQIQNDINNIFDKLENRYNISYEEATKIFTPTSEGYSEESIAKIKKQIESYGELNLAAPSEYQELEGRFTFLDKERNDLVQAKSDLHTLINKINKITKERFSETFDKVREIFQDVFTQLFEGGKADLVLTSNEDLLEAGIDIEVQPPGKKLQNISLLSGGERALVAIALLFSFYMIKASPFCILDEIDAPLDDANLKRFVRILKEFSKNSQFLVVTHNKNTMEMADILYGVTMEEFGVSKLISVKFQTTVA